MRIVYLSRGHGHGHAATDLQIVRALRGAGAAVRLASYGTGLDYLREHGEPCDDLRIDDLADQGTDAFLRVMAHLRARSNREQVDLVVAHEIFHAPEICRKLELRNVLLTHWFFSELGLPQRDSALELADHLLLLDFAEAHETAPGLEHCVFTGAVTTPFRSTRDQARQDIGIDDGETVIVVATGAIIGPNAGHLRQVVDNACSVHSDLASPVRLFVLSDVRPSEGEWVGRVTDPERYFAAADVVVANATFTTLCSLAGNGVPTVAITGGRNPVDRLHAEFFAANDLVSTVEVDAPPSQFVAAVRGATGSGPGTVLPWASPQDVADQLVALASTGGTGVNPATDTTIEHGGPLGPSRARHAAGWSGP